MDIIPPIFKLWSGPGLVQDQSSPVTGQIIQTNEHLPLYNLCVSGAVLLVGDFSFSPNPLVTKLGYEPVTGLDLVGVGPRGVGE